MTMMGESLPTPEFDAMQKNPFMGFLNYDDREVTNLIERVRNLLDYSGEYDQDITIVMEWDTLRDLVVIAEKLWAYRNRQGWLDEDSDQEG